MSASANDLLLHPATEYQFRALAQSGSHAILIAGSVGSGKRSLARKYAKQALTGSPYLLEIEADGASIGIDAIRNIKEFLSRKTTGQGELRRMVVIYDAHKLTTEAQNALLKTLEEPPADTIIVMTTDSLTSLKATIRSRAQQLRVLPVGLAEATDFFKTSYKPEQVEKAYHMSQGRAGLLKALLDESDEHELVTAIAAAKDILRQSPYERLTQVDKLSKNKEEALLLLEGLERVITSGLRLAAGKNDRAGVKKFYSVATNVQTAQKYLGENANAKLVLTDLFLNM